MADSVPLAYLAQEAPDSAEACWALLSLAGDEDTQKWLDLIAEAHSDNRSDPLEYDCDCRDDYQYDERDAVLWVREDGRNKADLTARHALSYHSELASLGLTEARLRNLGNGAKPTYKERSLYSSMIIAKIDAIPKQDLFNVCRIAVPEELGEKRAIYFTYEPIQLDIGIVLDVKHYTGPWRDISEIVGYLSERFEKSYCSFGLTAGKLPQDEKDILSGWLAKKKADDDVRYAARMKTQ